jgi:hypothetical protein
VPVVIDGQLFTASFESLVETSERGQAGYVADLSLEPPQLENGFMWGSYSVGGPCSTVSFDDGSSACC